MDLEQLQEAFLLVLFLGNLEINKMNRVRYRYPDKRLVFYCIHLALHCIYYYWSLTVSLIVCLKESLSEYLQQQLTLFLIIPFYTFYVSKALSISVFISVIPRQDEKKDVASEIDFES